VNNIPILNSYSAMGISSLRHVMLAVAAFRWVQISGLEQTWFASVRAYEFRQCRLKTLVFLHLGTFRGFVTGKRMMLLMNIGNDFHTEDKHINDFLAMLSDTFEEVVNFPAFSRQLNLL